MPTIEEMKTEIITEIGKRHSDNSQYQKIVEKIKEEIKVMSDTSGLESRNNFEVFYNVWRSNFGKCGSKNCINSWTAYFLGMTSQKPSGDFMPTRRAFARAGFPDIDTDFDYENRDVVYEYIINKYGRENVGNIGTHGLLKFKSCVTRVVKALDIANAFHKGRDAYITENAAKATEILESFPKKGLIKVIDDEGKSHIIKTFDDAYAFNHDFKTYMDKYPEVARHCRNIENNFANFGFHAAGMCVSDVPLDEIAPLRIAKQGILATQFPNEDLELLGLIKFDILAISTLTVIKKTVEKIKEQWDITVDIENLPLDDQKTFELYRSGNLGGVFQCENYGMQKTMREIGVDRFEDIIAGLALYRPGPMDSIPSYCARKKGEEKVDYFHKSIEKYVKPYLERTYGLLAYQEQVMQICNALAGFSITDGYVMIKAIGKKKEHLMKRFEKQFVDGCKGRGVPQDVAQQYWDQFITPFASYGFNLAHSACYGYNSYTTAYLKANYPEEFICSLLDVTINSSVGDRYEKASAFENEFSKKMNIKFLPRSIDKSKINYTVVKRKNPKNGIAKTEIQPSILCKGLSEKAANTIVKNQPYSDFRDFVKKIDSSVGSKDVEALLLSGYFGLKSEKQQIEMKKKFETLREDFKKLAKKGIESVDIFEMT